MIKKMIILFVLLQVIGLMCCYTTNTSILNNSKQTSALIGQNAQEIASLFGQPNLFELRNNETIFIYFLKKTINNEVQYFRMELYFRDGTVYKVSFWQRIKHYQQGVNLGKDKKEEV